MNIQEKMYIAERNMSRYTGSCRIYRKIPGKGIKSHPPSFKGSCAEEPLRLAKRVLRSIPVYRSSTRTLIEIQGRLRKQGITISSTFLNEYVPLVYPGQVDVKMAEYRNVADTIERMRKVRIAMYPQVTEDNMYSYCKDSENLCNQFGVANCGEYASIVMRRLVDLGFMDFCRIKAECKTRSPNKLLFEHDIVCIYPDDNSNIRGVLESPRAIVIDAWDRTAKAVKLQIKKILRMFGKTSIEELKFSILNMKTKN